MHLYMHLCIPTCIYAVIIEDIGSMGLMQDMIDQIGRVFLVYIVLELDGFVFFSLN